MMTSEAIPWGLRLKGLVSAPVSSSAVLSGVRGLGPEKEAGSLGLPLCCHDVPCDSYLLLSQALGNERSHSPAQGEADTSVGAQWCLEGCDTACRPAGGASRGFLATARCWMGR